MTNIEIEDWNGKRSTLAITPDNGSNLMEIITTVGYDILATCGGSGICATCHVLVMKGLSQLPPATADELATLDTLPDAEANSRLACQINTDSLATGMAFKISVNDY